MNPISLIIVVICFFAILETPVFVIIAGSTAAFLFFVDFDFLSLQMILIEMNRLGSMPVLIALPLFTLVGVLLTETRAPDRIMSFINAVVGKLPGGLAMAALCSCTFFTALTGASGVTIVALGSILYPVLRKRGYNELFSLGLVTTSGSLGLLFPPSLPVILYGVVAQVDIAKIFKAAFVPGMILVAALCLYAFIHDLLAGKKKHIPEKNDEQSVWMAFRGGLWDWPVIIIILTGIYGGIVTIAEVSAIVLLYVIIVECFILKEVHFTRQLPSIVVEAGMLSGAIVIILGTALAFTGYLVDEQIPGRLLTYLTSLTDSRIVFLFGLNLFLLAVGCMMDIFSAIVIIVPIVVPIAASYHVDPIHLCVIFLINLEIGYSTPPVGINLFIASLRLKKPITLLYRASVPYLLILLAVLILITYVPSLSLFLVK